MKTFAEFFFTGASLVLFFMFLPEIIGLGLLLSAALYLVSFVSGYKAGSGR